MGVFTTLFLARWRLGDRLARWQLLAWLAGLGLLYATGFYGGELVFGRGVGFLKE